MKKIAFIGGGNMAEAIIGGLVKSETQYDIGIFEPNNDRVTYLKRIFDHIKIYSDNKRLISDSQDVIILAVKPQVMDSVLNEISDVDKSTIILSIAAGINMQKIKTACKNSKIVRCMPNTPFLVGSGVGGICFDNNVTEDEKSKIINLFKNCGKLLEVNEEQIHAVTALSGSGPAYFFNFVEHLINAGINLGLSKEIAKELAISTAHGAGVLLINSDDEPSVLRQKVTSPKGTTEAALNSLEKSNFKEIVSMALKAAYDRSVELSK